MTTVQPCEPAPAEKMFPFGSSQLRECFTFVLFGATGDLAGRKLMPALANLWRNELLPKQSAFVGVGRRETSDDSFRDSVRRAIEEHTNKPADQCLNDFLSRVYFCRSDVSTGSLAELARRVTQSTLPTYTAGTCGPSEANNLMDARFGGWRTP